MNSDPNVWQIHEEAKQLARLAYPDLLQQAQTCSEEMHGEAIRRAARAPSAELTSLGSQVLDACEQLPAPSTDYTASTKLTLILIWVVALSAVQFVVFTLRFAR